MCDPPVQALSLPFRVQGCASFDDSAKELQIVSSHVHHFDKQFTSAPEMKTSAKILYSTQDPCGEDSQSEDADRSAEALLDCDRIISL